MKENSIYFLMCEKAFEIQLNWVPMRGDCVVVKEPSRVDEWIPYINEEESDHMFMVTVRRKRPREGVKFVFCPRQDQLQGMLEYMFKDSTCITRSMLYAFNEFWKFIGTDDKGNPKSHFYLEKDTNFLTPEAYWLAWVMMERYNKIWDFDNLSWKDF